MHSEILTNRIIQLGGTHVIKFDHLITTLKCCYQQPLSDLANLKQVVQDVLEAEACAIESYNELSEKYRETDIVTKEIFEDLLEDEVKDEEEWEKLDANLV